MVIYAMGFLIACIYIAKSKPNFLPRKTSGRMKDCRIPEALSDISNTICFFASSNLVAFNQQLLQGFAEQVNYSA